MARVTPLSPSHGDIELEGRRLLSLGQRIGRGSAAAVHCGVIEGGGRVRRTVAVKLFDVVATDERDSVVPRLARAARHAAAILHPNVVSTYEFGVMQGSYPYVITELVHGQSLQAFMDLHFELQQRMPLDLALFVGTEVAEGLLGARVASSEGHRAGVVHGELSPRDVLLSWHGEVKVSDFGIATAVGAASTVRRVSSVARRAVTLAPEVAKGKKGDSRSDVFSLGMMLHEMLIGPRFAPGTSDSDMLALAREGFVYPALFVPQLPNDLRAVVARAIEPDPARRFPHAGVIAYELRRVGMGLGVGDGRVFLRHALQSLNAAGEATSDERPVASSPTAPMDAIAWGKLGEPE
jgi:serine/threonine protein kinase